MASLQESGTQEIPSLRIFVSSPGDVNRERRIAEVVIERLNAEFGDAVNLAPYFWEYEPVVITKDYQAQIPPPSTFDIVICILWSRLGSRLNSTYTLPPDHKRVAESGTEYEFVDAALANKENGTPDILVWVNREVPSVPLGAEDRDERIRQWEKLQAFLRERTRDEKEQVFKGAVNSYRTREEFETRFEDSLRKLVQRRVGENQVGKSKPTWEGNPYQGLQVFEYEHAPIFFGRTKAIDELITKAQNRLHQVWARQAIKNGTPSVESPSPPESAPEPRAFVLVFGASGSGKSSLVQAGVLPMLVEANAIDGVGLWRAAVLKPTDGGRNLLVALASALVQPSAVPELLSDGTSFDELVQKLAANPDSANDLVKGGLSQAAAVFLTKQRHILQLAIERDEAEGRTADAELIRQKLVGLEQPRTCLALVLDQLEELFADGEDFQMVDVFFDVLEALATGGRVLVLATLRSDFFGDCERYDTLMRLKDGDGGSMHLLPPQRHELAQIVRGPAQKAGVRFEDGLGEILVDKAATDDDSLPLLEFCLNRLYDARHKNGTLTHKGYEAIGKFEGVLTQEANRVFDSLSLEAQAALDPLIRLLTSVAEADEGGQQRLKVVRRTVTREQIEAIPGAVEFVSAFEQARLFTGNKDAADIPTVSVTHEALLRRWDKVGDWLEVEENLHFLQLRDRVRQRQILWQSNGAVAELIPPGSELDQAQEYSERYPAAFSADETQFIQKSVAESERKEKRNRLVRNLVTFCLSLFAILAAGAAIFGFVQLSQKEDALVVKADALKKERDATALAKANEEAAKKSRAKELQGVLNAAQKARSMALDAFDSNNPRLGFAHLGQAMLYNSDLPPEIQLTDLTDEATRFIEDTVMVDPIPLFVLSDEEKVLSATYNSGGTRLLTFGGSRFGESEDLTVRLWNAVNGKKIDCPFNESDESFYAKFSNDGHQIVTIVTDGVAQVWDAESGNVLGEPIPHPMVENAIG